MNLFDENGVCKACGIKHDINRPHSFTKMYKENYQKYYGRMPNWDDALKYCDERTKRIFEKGLNILGKGKEG